MGLAFKRPAALKGLPDLLDDDKEKNMRVLITGASRGIGAGIARKLAHDARARGQGLHLAVGASQPGEAIDALVAELRGLDVQVRPLYGDLADAATPARLVAEAVEFCGGLDGLVANAGIMQGGALLDYDPAAWDWLFAVNVRANWLLARAAQPALVESRGSLVAVASMAGMHPSPGAGAYSPSKAALIMLCRQMAQEWAGQGIRVNSVSPGMVRTPLTEKVYQNAEVAARRDAIVPLGRVGAPEDIAGVVAFLLGEDSRYLTGQNLCVDGGYTNSILAFLPGLPKAQ